MKALGTKASNKRARDSGMRDFELARFGHGLDHSRSVKSSAHNACQ